MRPISLSVQGLTSFRQLQEISFEDLGLFVITGPTGAGKSSILDAMTLALYGDVCRISRNELKDLITHNASHVLVNLVFEVRGVRYRVTRRIKTKGPPEALLEQWNGTDWESMINSPGVRSVNAKIVELLGLDFDAFTKAVLLPQGRFHEFLSGDAETRRSILTRLLDLEKYKNLGSLARLREKDLASALDERIRRINEDYADATPERLSELKADIKTVKERADALSAAGKLASKLSVSLRDCRSTASRILDIAGRVAQLLRVLAELEQASAATADSDRATAAAVDDAQKAIEAAKQAHETVRARLAEAEANAGGSVDRLSSWLSAAQYLGKERQQIEHFAGRLKTIQTTLGPAQQRLEDASKAKIDAESALEASRSAGMDLTPRKERAEQAVKLLEAQNSVQECDAVIAACLAEAERASEEMVSSKASLDRLHDEHRGLALRAGLRPGEPCPVCEQLVTALPQERTELDSKLAQVRASAAAAEARHQSAQVALSEARRTQEALRQSMNELMQSVGEDRPSDLETAKSDLETMQVLITSAREQYVPLLAAAKQAEVLENENRENVRSIQAEINLVEQDRSGCEARIAEHLNALTQVFGEDVPVDAATVLETRLAALRTCAEEERSAAGAYNEATTLLAQAREARERFMRDRQAIDGQIEQAWGLANEYARATTEVLADRRERKLPDTSEVQAGSERMHDLVQFLSAVSGDLKATAQETERQILSLETDVAKLVEQFEIEISGQTPDAVDRAVEGAFREASLQVELGRQRVDHLQSQLEKRRTLQDEVTRDSKRRDLLNRIGYELQAGRFLAFVLSESMRSLADQATEELKNITGGRYSIEADETDFVVVDHNNADEKRSVATLSGGETFLASLALALALSRSVRDLAGNAAAARLESMFIDEGFGALDTETLDVAIDALEKLAGQDRMIGVISHVPALSERIEDGLDVMPVGVSSVVRRR